MTVTVVTVTFVSVTVTVMTGGKSLGWRKGQGDPVITLKRGEGRELLERGGILHPRV